MFLAVQAVTMKPLFDAIRPLFGKMSQEQVAGVEYLAERLRHLPRAYQAYLMATAFHETAATMMPIEEYGSDARFKKLYDRDGSKPELAKRLGNTEAGDGVRFKGRGYVQITGRANYANAKKQLNVDLISNPDRALTPEIATRVLVMGCTQGWFTGKKLGNYLDSDPPNYVGARRVVNGTDRAAKIAKYAETFERGLQALEGIEPEPPTNAFSGLLAAILAFLAAIFGAKK